MNIRLSIFMIISILVLIGGCYGLWKLEKWSRPWMIGVAELENSTKEKMLYSIRNKMIMLSLILVWIFTIVSGMLGVWKYITASVLSSISVLITICCVSSMVKRRYCNICLGSCMIYLGYLSLLAAFKIGYWQFAISYWWFVGIISLYTTFSILLLWHFIKSGKQTAKLSQKMSFSALGIALIAYPIAIGFARLLSGNNVGNDIAVPIIMAGLTLFALTMPFGGRYLVLDDSKILRPIDFREARRDKETEAMSQ